MIDGVEAARLLAGALLGRVKPDTRVIAACESVIAAGGWSSLRIGTTGPA